MNRVNKRTILLVDDDKSARQVVLQMLKRDYVVLEAANGEEAIKMARSQQPDIIILDVAMPTMDGYAACYAIKKDPITEAIPVIMLTSLSKELNGVLSRKMGASDHISKPCVERNLRDTISRFLPTS